MITLSETQYSEDDLLPLSGLQHLLFCERQCALIHVEQLWADNQLTVEGTHLHRNVDRLAGETRTEVRIARGVSLRSLRLGLVGRADVVEFHRVRDDRRVHWQPFPVEYKRGRPKRDWSDKIQLCAQALCLEEMLETPVRIGALYYGTARRRIAVAFDDTIRNATEKAAHRFREIVAGQITPSAKREPKCESCSLIEQCLPNATGRRGSIQWYVTRALAASAQAVPEDDEHERD